MLVPELPDVEGFRRELAHALPGRRICDVDVHDAGVLRNAAPESLRRKLTGHRFDARRRHGKWLILPTDGPDPSCPRCGAPLATGRAGGRTSLWVVPALSTPLGGKSIGRLAVCG